MQYRQHTTSRTALSGKYVQQQMIKTPETQLTEFKEFLFKQIYPLLHVENSIQRAKVIPIEQLVTTRKILMEPILVLVTQSASPKHI